MVMKTIQDYVQKNKIRLASVLDYITEVNPRLKEDIFKAYGDLTLSENEKIELKERVEVGRIARITWEHQQQIYLKKHIELENLVGRKLEKLLELPENSCEIELDNQFYSDHIVRIFPIPKLDVMQTYFYMLKNLGFDITIMNQEVALYCINKKN